MLFAILTSLKNSMTQMKNPVIILLIQSLIACHSVKPMQSKSAGRLSILPTSTQPSSDYEEIENNDYDEIDNNELDDSDINDDYSGEENFDFEEPFLQIVSQIRDPRLCSPSVFNNVFENRSHAVELRKNRDYTRFCIEERLRQSNMSAGSDSASAFGAGIPKAIQNKVPVSASTLKKIMKNLPKCQPRKEYVQLGLPGEAGISYFPSCVLVKRCSSCDAQRNLMSSCGKNKVCLPSQTRTKRVKVLALKQDHDGILTLRDNPVATINVQEHARCECQCQNTRNDCSAKEVFDGQQCRCKCRNEAVLSGRCGRDKFWHKPSCACRCKNLPPDIEEFCSTNWKFNVNTCQCERI